jgi:hypothetical protein
MQNASVLFLVFLGLDLLCLLAMVVDESISFSTHGVSNEFIIDKPVMLSL